MVSVTFCTWPLTLCSGPPNCGSCYGVESICRAAPPAPPPVAAVALSSAHGPVSGPPSGTGTLHVPLPKPSIRPPVLHTWPCSHYTVPVPLHAGNLMKLALPV